MFSGANLYSLPLIGLNCNMPVGKTRLERKSCKIQQFRTIIQNKEKHRMAAIGFFCYISPLVYFLHNKIASE